MGGWVAPLSMPKLWGGRQKFPRVLLCFLGSGYSPFYTCIVIYVLLYVSMGVQGSEVSR